jgi:hypothetical protein
MPSLPSPALSPRHGAAAAGVKRAPPRLNQKFTIILYTSVRVEELGRREPERDEH